MRLRRLLQDAETRARAEAHRHDHPLGVVVFDRYPYGRAVYLWAFDDELKILRHAHQRFHEAPPPISAAELDWLRARLRDDLKAARQ